MKFKNVLLLYKRSAFRIYFIEKQSSLKSKRNSVVKQELKKFQQAHDTHYQTLKAITKILFTHGVNFQECYRGRNVNYKNYDLIITVGGDGTFLEASRNAKNQVILGVNSAPDYSVGRFCVANAQNFDKILSRLLYKSFKPALLHRLQVKVEGTASAFEALNDVLVCHSNPAMLCRYYIQMTKQKEEQRSSGIWISTPAGSSGAIYSAGGQKINSYLKKFQYIARELYPARSRQYKLKGGILQSSGRIKITSLMRKGMVYFDGAHQKCAFEYGKSLVAQVSPNPIKTVHR